MHFNFFKKHLIYSATVMLATFIAGCGGGSTGGEQSPNALLDENHPPVARSGDYFIDRGNFKPEQEIFVPIHLTADDEDNDSLSYTIVKQPLHGKLEGSAPDIRYFPDNHYNGSDMFTFKANDGIVDSQIATIHIKIIHSSVDPIQDIAPIAEDDSVSTRENVAVIINVLANDYDPDSYIDPSTITITASPTHGTAVISDGKVRYTPNKDYHGNDSFKYTVKDNEGAVSNEAGVSVLVSNTNDVPTASPQHLKTNEDQPVNVTLSGSDPDGDTISYIIVSQPIHGKLSGNAPNLIYTPNLDYHGTDSFTFKVNDGQADSSVATISITVESINDTPVAADDSISTKEDTQAIADVLFNDTDIDGSLDPSTITITASPTHGTAVISDGKVRYTPNKDYHGNDSFKYTVKDNEGAVSNEAGVSVTIESVNDAPIAIDDNTTVDEGKAITIEPLLNDIDPDGNSSKLKIVSITQPRHGIASFDGKYVLYSSTSSGESNDSFNYVVEDEGGAQGSATIHISIVQHNDPPLAYGSTVETDEDTTISFDLNGSDPDGDPITYHLANQSYVPAHGTVSGTPPHLTYTPADNFAGDDYVTFIVNDGDLNSSTAMVKIVVRPLNDPPVADAGNDYTGIRGDNVHFDASGSYDVDGNITSYIWKEGNMTLSRQKIFDHRIMTEGIHTVILTVTDDQNATDTDEKIITINPCCQGCIYPDPTQTNPFD